MMPGCVREKGREEFLWPRAASERKERNYFDAEKCPGCVCGCGVVLALLFFCLLLRGNFEFCWCTGGRLK